MPRRRPRKRSGRALLLLLLLVCLALAAYVYAGRAPVPAAAPDAPAAPAGTLRVHYLDVGQGDGTVWELPDDSLVVYDCGPPAEDAARNPMVSYLRDTLGRPEGSRLTALLASHGHLDHVGGCEEVLAAYDFERIYDTDYGGDDAPASYHRFRGSIEAEGATLVGLPSIRPGEPLPLPSAKATFLWPPAFAPGGWDAIAEASLVVRLQHGATSFCFQGDIEEQQERQLEGACDVYLVGHHGSKYASSAPWLARMGPSIAVVSYGPNEYGHPTPEALCRVQQAGAQVHATAGAGAIIVESDGASVRATWENSVSQDFCLPASLDH